mgnify:CR=1 FL=1
MWRGQAAQQDTSRALYLSPSRVDPTATAPVHAFTTSSAFPSPLPVRAPLRLTVYFATLRFAPPLPAA